MLIRDLGELGLSGELGVDEITGEEGWVIDADERLEAWRDLLANASANKGPALLVTSNGAARFALLAAPDLARASARLESLKLPTGGFGIVARGKSGRLELVEWGKRPCHPAKRKGPPPSCALRQRLARIRQPIGKPSRPSPPRPRAWTKTLCSKRCAKRGLAALSGGSRGKVQTIAKRPLNR